MKEQNINRDGGYYLNKAFLAFQEHPLFKEGLEAFQKLQLSADMQDRVRTLEALRIGPDNTGDRNAWFSFFIGQQLKATKSFLEFQESLQALPLDEQKNTIKTKIDSILATLFSEGFVKRRDFKSCFLLAILRAKERSIESLIEDGFAVVAPARTKKNLLAEIDQVERKLQECELLSKTVQSTFYVQWLESRLNTLRSYEPIDAPRTDVSPHALLLYDSSHQAYDSDDELDRFLEENKELINETAVGAVDRLLALEGSKEKLEEQKKEKDMFEPVNKLLAQNITAIMGEWGLFNRHSYASPELFKAINKNEPPYSEVLSVRVGQYTEKLKGVLDESERVVLRGLDKAGRAFIESTKNLPSDAQEYLRNIAVLDHNKAISSSTEWRVDAIAHAAYQELVRSAYLAAVRCVRVLEQVSENRHHASNTIIADFFNVEDPVNDEEAFYKALLESRMPKAMFDAKFGASVSVDEKGITYQSIDRREVELRHAMQVPMYAGVPESVQRDYQALIQKELDHLDEARRLLQGNNLLVLAEDRKAMLEASPYALALLDNTVLENNKQRALQEAEKELREKAALAAPASNPAQAVNPVHLLSPGARTATSQLSTSSGAAVTTGTAQSESPQPPAPQRGRRGRNGL